MHPAVCDYVSELAYDGRLRSADGCERQVIMSRGLSGAGIRCSIERSSTTPASSCSQFGYTRRRVRLAAGMFVHPRYAICCCHCE